MAKVTLEIEPSPKLKLHNTLDQHCHTPGYEVMINDTLLGAGAGTYVLSKKILSFKTGMTVMLEVFTTDDMPLKTAIFAEYVPHFGNVLEQKVLIEP